MATRGALWLLLLTLAGESLSGSVDLLSSDCQQLCSVCNATGRVHDGFCKCFSDNGGEVVCLQQQRRVRQVDTNLRGVSQDQMVGLGEEKDLEDAMRGQRCLGVLGSTRGALQNILGQGLRNMSAADRLTEFRKRVEALRTLSRQRSKSRVGLNSPLGVSTADALKTDLPVSPFIGQPLGELPGNAAPKTDLPVSPVIGKALGELPGNADAPKTDLPVSPFIGQPLGELPGNSAPKTDLPVSPMLGEPLEEVPGDEGVPKTDNSNSPLLGQPVGEVPRNVEDMMQTGVEANEPPQPDEPSSLDTVNPPAVATSNTRRSAKSILPALEGLNLDSVVPKVPGIQPKNIQTDSSSARLRSNLNNEGRVLRSSNPFVVNPFVPNNYFINPALSGQVASNPIISNPLAANPIAPNPLLSSPTGSSPLLGNPLAANPIAPNPLLSSPTGSSPLLGNPLASNPLAGMPIDAHSILAAIGQGHIIPNLSLDVPNKASVSNISPRQTFQNPVSSTSSNADARADSSPQFNPIGLAQNIYGVANGDMKAVQGIVESTGVRKELGDMVQGIFAIPQNGRTATQQ